MLSILLARGIQVGNGRMEDRLFPTLNSEVSQERLTVLKLDYDVIF